MENIEFYTLEISSPSCPDFTPCKSDGEVIEFCSMQEAISKAPYYSCFKADCVFRVVRHVHFSQVICEVSKFSEPLKLEYYDKKD